MALAVCSGVAHLVLSVTPRGRGMTCSFAIRCRVLCHWWWSGGMPRIATARSMNTWQTWHTWPQVGEESRSSFGAESSSDDFADRHCRCRSAILDAVAALRLHRVEPVLPHVGLGGPREAACLPVPYPRLPQAGAARLEAPSLIDRAWASCPGLRQSVRWEAAPADHAVLMMPVPSLQRRARARTWRCRSVDASFLHELRRAAVDEDCSYDAWQWAVRSAMSAPADERSVAGRRAALVPRAAHACLPRACRGRRARRGASVVGAGLRRHDRRRSGASPWGGSTCSCAGVVVRPGVGASVC